MDNIVNLNKKAGVKETLTEIDSEIISEKHNPINFKVQEDVECDMCGEMATMLDGGIAGMCEHCGNQWGTWDCHDDECFDDDDDDNMFE